MTEKTKPKSPKKKPKKATAEAQSVLGNLPATRPSRLARRHDEPAKAEAPAKEPAKSEAAPKVDAPAKAEAAPKVDAPAKAETAPKADTAANAEAAAKANAPAKSEAAAKVVAAKADAPAKAEAAGPPPPSPAAEKPRATEPAKKAGTRTTRPATAAKAKPAARRTGAAKAKPSARRTAAKPKPVVAVAPEREPVAPKTFDSTAAAETAAPPKNRPRPVRAGSPALEQPERREAAKEPSNGGAPRGTELVTTAIQAAGELAQIGITVGGQLLKRTLERFPGR